MINYADLIKSFTKEDYLQGRVNLHIHTKYSDGKADFAEIIKQSKIFKSIAICDHNTIQGYIDNDIPDNVIPAVEFDVWYKYIFLHLLAYGINFTSDELKPFLAKNKRETEFDMVRIFADRNLKKLINAIHSVGGIAILAHPACCWTLNHEKFIKELAAMGLDGLEVYYPYNRHRGIIKFTSTEKIEKIADKFGLIKTGGTDLHGYNLI